MFFVKCNNHIISSNAICNIFADEAKGKIFVNFKGCAYDCSISVKKPLKVLDKILNDMARAEACTVGMVVNYPKCDYGTFVQTPVCEVNHEALIIDLDNYTA